MKKLILEALKSIGVFLLDTDFKDGECLLKFLNESKNFEINKMDEKDCIMLDVYCNHKSVIVSKINKPKVVKPKPKNVKLGLNNNEQVK